MKHLYFQKVAHLLREETDSADKKDGEDGVRCGSGAAFKREGGSFV